MDPLLRVAPKAMAFLRDVLKPEHHGSATRFNTVVSSHRVFDTRRFLESEFERIRGLVPGATLNDAVLAVCAGGLRRYLELHGELPETDLDAFVPQTLDASKAASPAPGAAVASSAPRRITLGTHLDDAVQRLAWIRDQTAAPPPLAARQSTPASCTVTHVVGPLAAMYLHGARMSYFSAILPIADGKGLVFAITQYDRRIVISPTSCRELMPDPQLFTQCVRDTFQDYLALTPPAKRVAPKKRLAPRAKITAAASPKKARPGESASGRSSQLARRAGTAAKPLQAATAARRRSKAPRR
jgi:diacylglycerol O-acyltransferase